MPSVASPTVETIKDTALIVRQVVFTAAGSVTLGTFILCDASSGAFTLTLPLAGQQDGSRILIIKKIDSSANAVTISRAGSDTIDGSNTLSLSTQYDAVILGDDESGGLWAVLGQHP